MSKCPHCRSKLGNFYYADACPHCHKELEHNQSSKLTVTPRKGSLAHSQMFPLPIFRWFVRLVEA